MTDNNNWPGKPGVPMNPEQDSEGHVWRVDGVMDIHRWVAKNQWYENQRGFWVTPDQLIADGDTYFGRIVTPAEVDARVKEARRNAREEAAQEMDCACPQRGAVLEKLAKDGPLSHYWPCEKGDDCCALRGAAIRALKGEGDE
jgi:hypothetical protein